MQHETPRTDWRRYLPRLLLLIPFLAMVWVPSYNRLEPKLGDIPFFYWYQTVWTFLGTACTIPVYLYEEKKRK